MSTKNRPWRPPIDGEGLRKPAVCVRLGASDYDNVYRLAKQHRVSMPDIIRRGVKHLIKDQRGGSL